MSLTMLTLRKRNLACKSKMTIILSNDLRNQEREEKKIDRDNRKEEM
jgi:hypothetical protein